MLDAPLSKTTWKHLDESCGNTERDWQHSPPRTIGQPLLIAGKPKRDSLPHPRQLWEIGKQALEALKTTNQLETSFGPWSGAVRTVRADR